jgi:NAD+ diphosphatase
MVAFKAEYAGGDPKLQPEEISEIAWFTKEDLPPIPKIGSIAHKLITEF